MEELAEKVSTKYLKAIEGVRKAIVSEGSLINEDWASLTRHVTESFIFSKFRKFGYLKCKSADSVVDGIISPDGKSKRPFDPGDERFLLKYGIQVKGRRYVPRKGYGTTGDINLKSKFKYLYVVWVNKRYEVMKEEGEVYRLKYNDVVKIIKSKIKRNGTKGLNNYKLSHAEVQPFRLSL